MAPRRAAAHPPARRARSSRASRLPSTVAHDVAVPAAPSAQASTAGSADGELGSRMGQAVQELASTPVEEGRHIGSSLAQALHDPEFVERASRWRGGNYGRQVASVLAKVAKYLRIVKPEILESASTACALQPVRPLPLGSAAAAPTWWTLAQRRLADSLPRLGSNRSWFMWWGMTLVILLYPRMVAAILVLVLRLCLRALALVLGRLIAELWSEARSCIWTALQSSWVLEDHLVSWLDAAWGGSSTTSSRPAPRITSPPPSEPAVATSAGEPSPPPSALLSSSCALTFAWVADNYVLGFPYGGSLADNYVLVTLFRRSLRDLDLGFALGAWRLLNKAQQQRGSTGTWSLSSPLRFAELEALLATLRVAQSAELREEQSRCRPPLPSLAALWARGSSAAPCSEWRLHRVAQRGSAQRWREAKELAYFQQQQLPLVDPRSSSLRGLRVEQLEELLRGHAAYLQEPAFDEELQCHRRPSCWEFYAKGKTTLFKGSKDHLWVPGMATFRFVHCATGLPLHIDGCGDKLASVRYGDCRDDFSLFWLEPAGEDGTGESPVFLRSLAMGLPLHINGLGDSLASVRCGDCRDDFSKFHLEEAAEAGAELRIRHLADDVLFFCWK
eukprot:s3152_g9.t1